LQVVFEGFDPDTMAWSLSAPSVRRIGGRVDPAGYDALALRVLLDHSLLEVFTGSGQVITTRVYRGAPPAPARDAGLDFLSFGGAAELVVMNAWEMATIWDPPLVRCATLQVNFLPESMRM
jgi:Glycosyl hydrolases family 32 C terminal